MDIIIRNYMFVDKIRLLELIKIYNQYFSDIDPWKVLKYPKNAPKYYLEQMIQGSTKNGKFFVAEKNGIVVGFIHGQIHKQSKAEIMERGKRISGDIKDFLFWRNLDLKVLEQLL